MSDAAVCEKSAKILPALGCLSLRLLPPMPLCSLFWVGLTLLLGMGRGVLQSSTNTGALQRIPNPPTRLTPTPPHLATLAFATPPPQHRNTRRH